MEFHSIGRVGVVEILDVPDGVPRMLRLRCPRPDNVPRFAFVLPGAPLVDGDGFVHVDLTPADAARLSRNLSRGIGSAGLMEQRSALWTVLLSLATERERTALATFVGAWVRFENDAPPRRPS